MAWRRQGRDAASRERECHPSSAERPLEKDPQPISHRVEGGNSVQVPGRTPSGATNRRHGPVSHLSNMWETELKRQPGPGAEHVKCHPSFRPALTRGLTHSTHTTTQTRTRAAIQCPWAVLAIGGSFLLTRKAQSGFFSMLSEPLVRLVLSDLSLRSFASLPLLLLDSLPVLATSSLLTVLGGVD